MRPALAASREGGAGLKVEPKVGGAHAIDDGLLVICIFCDGAMYQVRALWECMTCGHRSPMRGAPRRTQVRVTR